MAYDNENTNRASRRKRGFWGKPEFADKPSNLVEESQDEPVDDNPNEPPLRDADAEQPDQAFEPFQPAAQEDHLESVDEDAAEYSGFAGFGDAEGKAYADAVERGDAGEPVEAEPVEDEFTDAGDESALQGPSRPIDERDEPSGSRPPWMVDIEMRQVPTGDFPTQVDEDENLDGAYLEEDEAAETAPDESPVEQDVIYEDDEYEEVYEDSGEAYEGDDYAEDDYADDEYEVVEYEEVVYEDDDYADDHEDVAYEDADSPNGEAVFEDDAVDVEWVEEELVQDAPTPQAAPRPRRVVNELRAAQRIEVDGDYRLAPEDRVTSEDVVASNAGRVWPLGHRDAEPVPMDADSAYLSGPHAGLSRRGRRIRIIAVVAAVVVTVLVLYGVGVNRFSQRYLPNTSIHGCDVSGMTRDEARQALDTETTTYSCAVSTGEFSLTVTGSDIGLKRDPEPLLEKTWGKASAFTWPIALFAHNTYEPDNDVTFDKENLSQLVSRAVDSYNDRTLPSDGARIALNEETGSYEVTGEIKGSAVDEKTVETAILDSVRAMQTQCNPDPGRAFRSAVVTDLPDYRNVVEHANTVRTSDIDVLVEGETVTSSPADQNAAWISIAEGPKIAVDKDGVRAWAEETVSTAAYHTDDWNAYMLDTDTFVDEFCARLSSGNVEGYEAPLIDERTREGISRDKAYEHTKWNKEFGRYIDVDLQSQFARLFDNKGEVLWESAFVSGDLVQGHSTVEGTFSIYSKQMGTVLTGLDYDGDGNPDYQSYVNYWMPFYGGYGLHDATWRSAFGGDLYQYDGSHGCVNLPYEKAKELFDITYVGEVVYVHW